LNSPNYIWKIPTDLHEDGAKCILRIRYNITTADFVPGSADSWNVFSDKNGANSPLEGNPADDFVGLGLGKSGPLRLNINTAQFGRTFQDRSHVFRIRKRPNDLQCGLKFSSDCKIINVNVRGRRGNIQQTYPAVEYDFVPPVITASRNDLLHIQWTGADSNQKNNEGNLHLNKGNGRAGTDRSNMVIIKDLATNKPSNLNELLRSNSTPIHFSNDNDIIAYLAYLNQTSCDIDSQDTNADNNCKLLNNSPGYINAGLVRIDNVGTFYLMSTRNNAFSNRDQKSVLIVQEDAITMYAVAAMSVSGAGLGVLCTIGFMAFLRKFRTKKLLKHSPVLGSSPDISSNTESLSLNESKSDWAKENPRKAQLAEWYIWNKLNVRAVIFMVVMQIASGLFGYFSNLKAGMPPYFPYAKATGKILDFNLCFVLLPVMRNFISFLRTTAIADELPLDSSLDIHKWTAYSILLAACAHIIFHSLNFVWSVNNEAIPIYFNYVATITGITGVLVTLFMLSMFLSTMINRKIYKCFGKRFDGYKIFLNVHLLWMPIYFLLIFHGSQFWQYVCFPLFFMAVEKFIQSKRTKMEVVLLEHTMVASDVMCIKMKLAAGRKKFRYMAGQYLFLCCPTINESEYHPFTITSAPEENHFSVHIRCRKDMDWCYTLRGYLGKEFTLKVDGPYGSASEDVFFNDTVILVG
jgi:predicted ferric reductase